MRLDACRNQCTQYAGGSSSSVFGEGREGLGREGALLLHWPISRLRVVCEDR